MPEPTFEPLLRRIAETLERFAPAAPTNGDLAAVNAFVWRAESGLLEPVAAVNAIDYGLLKGMALFTARRYDEAIAALRTIKDPMNEVRGWLAASYAGAGRLDEARALLDEFLRVAEDDMVVFPGRKLAAWEDYWHAALEYQNEADFEHLYEALRKAGMED